MKKLSSDTRTVERAPASTSDWPVCITQDAREPASHEYLGVCTVNGTEIADSIHCPPECGGHPVCRPCLTLAVARGLVAAPLPA